MNQTSAAILVLASSVFSYAAVNTRTTTQTPTFLALVAVGIGLWGILALISGILRERELFVDNHARLDVFDRLFVRDSNRAPVRTSSRERPIDLSADVQAQVNVTAELEGRDRSDVVEETLRRHLPKYTKSRVA